MKKVSMLLLCTLLFITGCVQDSNDEEVLQNDDTKEETSIVPSYQLSDENYRMILPYKTSAARGVIGNQIANRVDIDEMEEGLRRLSKEVFDPEELYFQEGQYLTSDMIYTWIDELNPKVKEGADEETYQENPRYLSHILEQNYMRHNEDQSVGLAGISLGIAMKSVYRFQTQVGGPYFYKDIPKDEMLSQANEIAHSILQEIRQMEGLGDVPIMIGIYQEEEQASPVPGNFVAKANVPGGSTSIDDWESVNEENILFPSDEGREKYYDDHEIVSSFGNEIAKFFPNYVGLMGEGFYIDEELQKLTIEIPIEFYGKAEVLGFTQYAYGLVQDMFPNYYDLEVNIKTSQQMESLIYRNAGDESPTVHVYD
ncbi:CamS family sex pheromone protein [Oceanobacillus massiliensis]|uniref:CamS family sex pheromone protein n=1 Tax=Oceanobacillus massiliensis TaxID=1465765 RepID=UPI00028A259A|nr:CamS family sex pheromone protein [Oceanobacillus massiliensis]